jgi:hypothetical protein
MSLTIETPIHFKRAKAGKNTVAVGPAPKPKSEESGQAARVASPVRVQRLLSSAGNSGRCSSENPDCHLVRDPAKPGGGVIEPRRWPSQLLLNATNICDKYNYWIAAAVERLKVHTETYASTKFKPVLFIMAENTS